MKKMLYKNVKRYEDIEGLTAAISDAWDRLTKNSSIFSRPMVDAIRKSGRRRQWLH